MTFSKSFPRTDDKTTYPTWEEIILNFDSEGIIDSEARSENLKLMRECIEDARKLFSDSNLRDYQSDLVRVAISLFEKRASHVVYWKESKCKELFDEKFNKS
ncbi:hypothetical protein HN865_05265 [Candidatus Woesearchaeota archaeon]|jgi:hypothetical protein|nr:hypothetical protein [Candidatus Woesearchaeota archaeon]MBT7238227.1 hypothetical protein [Candidatus Woesearchaeota archaeon]